MKKQLAILTLVASIGGTAYAFVSTQTQLFTARATATGTRTATFTAALRPAANPEGAGANLSQIGWNAAAGAGWTLADATLRLNFAVNDRRGGIQIYTNNTIGTANPRFVDPTPATTINPDSNPAGMLLVPAVGTTSSERMDMAWSVKPSSAIPGGLVDGTGIRPADPNNGSLTGTNNKFQWLYVVDKLTPAIDRNGDGDVLDTDPVANPNPDLRDTVAFTNEMDFVQVVKFNSIHFGQSPTEYGVDDDRRAYIYFQANLNQAAPGDVFQTNTLTLEAYIQ